MVSAGALNAALAIAGFRRRRTGKDVSP